MARSDQNVLQNKDVIKSMHKKFSIIEDIEGSASMLKGITCMQHLLISMTVQDSCKSYFVTDM